MWFDCFSGTVATGTHRICCELQWICSQ